MSDETRKGAPDLPHREEVLPKDHETYTPQGGGSGTGSGPIQEIGAVEKASEVAPVTSVPAPEEGEGAGVTLPLVGPEKATAEALGLTAEGGNGDGAAPPEQAEVSSFRLMSTLTVAGMVAGALLVFVYLWSEPLIQAYNAQVLREAVTEVLKGPDHFESVFIVDGELTTEVPAGVDTLDLDKVFLGYDTEGSPVGFAMVHQGFGFQDLITVIFGYDAESRQVLGMKVLDHAETPGLGNKIEDQPYVGEFDGAETPLEGVKPDRNTGAANQVDMITGVTISSRAVVRIINERLEAMADLLAAYKPPAAAAGADPAQVPGGGEDR
jgi:electron transport complex protein RnfG